MENRTNRNRNERRRYRLALPKYACPCCGYDTLTEPAGGTFEICPVCFWEDDRAQLADPSYAGGANGISLEEARENYRRFGVSREDLAPFVRPPKKSEMRNRGRGPESGEEGSR